MNTRISESGNNQPLALGASDAAKAVGVSKRTWWRLVASGKAPPGHKLGSRRVWRVEDIKKFVADGFRWEVIP
ncbi:MAG: helix-turn-helix domain-containing protein [Planctomycetes bacterium]|nr:helix-turn-helix domain-containing protein [Planctomycetota bacterium]